ncbi:MAG: glutathione S-transferase N-terminal domain-containing protein [Halieaceae bacterium]|nr:glutathione S-transferase N-terminal domain-containing protein [Halieaceae bacterium]
MDNELMRRLAELLEKAGEAHHQAFAATDGADPDWSIWYADYLFEPITQQLGLELHKSQLIYCLMDADNEYRAMAAESPWPDFYAGHLMECHAPAESPAEEKLALYHFQGCPFCSMARVPIDRLGIDVELRDIYQDRQHMDDLVAARGRATVPVLRITTADGEDRWMPESRDIVHYLESTYG